ncbi:ABC transporter substrate-binding protein [Conexibacter woesei]|uniref:Extracellular solute-binding protein family 1 n=1 Tax=Conexibacter woesei (strain DSM 14684 / CCUG 47730 / CIP 108061 / JCM 11494 / NBRC 100937 / ID131577) TaxID=469383 RepID=D3F3K9_CONWI|nr:ABC transporter substrate-binding protein [Conexibacter woesei]ADB52374.1 extracellular solute-binding protein family 1 [Conexibacter woesei DSM 14684]
MRRWMATGAAVMLSVLAVLSAGCGGDSAGGSGDDGVVEITFWHGQTEETATELNTLIDEFNETHPRIRVSKDAGGVQADDMLTKVTAALAGGSYPDIAYIFGPDVANVARSPKVLDLTETVRAPDWTWDDFYKPERDAVTVDGKVRAVPALADVLAVIYNKRLFADAGVPEPDGTWTWDEFRATAKQLTDRGKGVFGTSWPGVGGEDTVWRLWPMVWQLGGEILSPDGTSVGFDDDSGLRSLTTIHDLAVTDESTYIDPDPSSDRTGQLFQNGKLAMWTAGPWALLDVRVSGVEAGVARLPSYDGEPLSIAGPDNYVLFDNGSARSRAAIEFVKWLTAAEQDLRYSEATGHLPLRKSATRLPGYPAFARTWPGIPVFVESLETAKVRPTIEAYPELSDAVGKGIVSVLLDRASPADALKTMSEQANDVLASE